MTEGPPPASSSSAAEHLPPRTGYLKNEIPIAGVAHQAGTVRFGTDPATSVLDVDCRAHEVGDHLLDRLA